MKNIFLLICLLLSCSLYAAQTYTEADIIDAIKKIDQMLNGEKPPMYKSGKTTKKKLEEDRKILMKNLRKMGGKDKEEEILWACVNKHNGWKQTWTKNNNPETTCKRKRSVGKEDCAIKAGEAKTDSAANLIYLKCEKNVNTTFDMCMDSIKVLYKGLEPKVLKCVDQAYLEN